jgi:hypothetical protein
MAEELDILSDIIADIRPFNYDSKTAALEFKSIETRLRDSNPDKWALREKALKQLGGMALAHEMDEAEFAKAVRSLKTSLALQVCLLFFFSIRFSFILLGARIV